MDPVCVNPIVIAKTFFNKTAESACTAQHGRFVSVDNGEFYCRHQNSAENATVVNPGGCGYLVFLPPNTSDSIQVLVDFQGFPTLGSSGSITTQGIRVYARGDGCVWIGAGPKPAQ
ncbi:MAG: hypothetical protein JWM87_2819 [Candidatus Eremiobacteraeota bacterium]|nr:hypothetical protein [Candidatus Eremiobacteraeota bacterium]